MAEVIRMPKMSDTMEEGVIAQWLKKEGEEVKAGDILAEVETDKATMELESYEDGTLLHVGVKDGDSVPINSVIAVIGNKGEDISSILKEVNVTAATTANVEVVENVSPGAVTTSDSLGAAPAIEEKIDTSGIKASIVTMPKMSDTMTEGVIASWLKKEGDQVKSGDILAEVETDKATMELESYEDGTLLYIGAKAGESVAIDGVLAIIGEKGADFQTLIKAHSATNEGVKKESLQAEASSEATVAASSNDSTAGANVQVVSTSKTSSNGRVKASPLAKKLAEEKGFDISQIPGTGEGGRIVKRDVEIFQPSAQPATSTKAAPTDAIPAVTLPQIVGEESFEEVSLSQMRKTIARRLSESKFTSPHFYLTMEVNMDKAIEARKSMNEVAPVKISFNDMVVKAVAVALRKNPKVNVSWLDDKIRFNKHIHIGVAVAVDEGLLVPVIRFADNKTLSHISMEVKDLAKKAVDKKLQPEDWEGSTFTISNLGMFGIEEFTAIINPPDACILAVGGIKQTAIVKDGELVPGNVMKVTMSCDHRAVDGAVGSAFLQTFKEMLEDPVRILI
jgi:pyruvate dehydrogenase E2 component (dihydrolipoamide acetyltransferase)